jgi:hypothetical protein
MKYYKAFKLTYKKNKEFSVSEFQLVAKTLCFTTLFLFCFTIISPGAEPIPALDFSGSGPLFLSKNQMRSDVLQAERLLRENYVRYPILEKSGVKWESAFQRLTDHLSINKNPTLTHHFQKQLIKALEFTEDANLRTDLFLKKRHYIKRVEPKVAFYSGIRLAQDNERFRVLPTINFADKIVNHWYIGCTTQQEVFFPILPERQSEVLFMMGQQANIQLEPLDCKFENDSGEKHNIILPLLISEAELNRPEMPVYEYKSGRTPYIRWYRDGRTNETSVKQFQKLALKLRKTSTLIIDVRGNQNGSFAFIENWLKEFTSNHWKNVIVRERQTLPILKGLLNRVQWNLHHSALRLLIGRDQLEQKRRQLQALIEHLREKGITEKWVETKFIFNGNKNAPKWNTRLIVLTNQHCGNGCQFLAALTKQIPQGVLIGANTGPFPKNTSGPIFQLKHSRVMLSFSHRLHLNHQAKPVSPSGYLPDYWLFPPMGIRNIQRFISKYN